MANCDADISNIRPNTSPLTVPVTFEAMVKAVTEFVSAHPGANYTAIKNSVAGRISLKNAAIFHLRADGILRTENTGGLGVRHFIADACAKAEPAKGNAA